MEFPYAVEYAKSNRAGCKACKINIPKDALRMAIMVQSPHFDGQIPNWFHFNCFWSTSKAKQLKSENEIKSFENLRWDDQEKIRQRLQGKSADGSTNGAAANKDDGTQYKLDDFQVEYAKTSAAKCRDCDNKILKNEVRIGRQEGARTLWYHLSCFSPKRAELGFSFDPTKMTGYDGLKDDDKTVVGEKMKTTSKRSNDNDEEAQPSKKKSKKDVKNEGAPAENPEVTALKKQNEDLWKLRDQLTAALTKKQWGELLTANNQVIPSGGDAKVLDRLTDCMLFGALEKCTECPSGQLVYSTSVGCYICTGNVSGFTKCQFSTSTPKRIDFVIPDDLMEEEFLEDFVFTPGRKRLMPPKAPADGEGTSKAAAAESKTGRLSQLKFVVLSTVNTETREKIRELGGVLVPKVDAKVIAVVAPKDSNKFEGAKGEGKDVVEAKKHHVHIVSEEFIAEIRDKKNNVVDVLEKYKKCDWGSDINERITKAREADTAKKSGSKSAFKSNATSQKMTVKGGAAVEPDFEYAALAHVYQDKERNLFTAVLGRADVQTGQNSYYKLQLLEHDTSKKFWIFRAWGRVGTTIGGNKTDDFGSSLDDAVEEFLRLYLEKTGNDFYERQNFEKKPHLMYPIDVDYGQDDEESKSKVEAGTQSKLPKAVQNLIQLIFDVEQMKQTMKECDIDLKKMPLGKLSKKHIKDAYKILTELQEELAGRKNATKILDCSNRFFTLIPHDFGLDKPPLMDNEAIVKAKTEMLDNLLEIEVAYAILKGDTGDRDPIDVHYEKLKTEMEVLDQKSDTFKMVQDYVKNTHASTHRQYELVVEDVFAVKREGEVERYNPFNKLHNRMLLWHGSRTSNFGGILSQGLRIAPPEAPSTGYMFGKGIYFADMVSKSANYCYTNKQNPTGLVMLCEVALGEMQEFKNASYVTELPKGKHSVKGVGQTAPDPRGAVIMENGTMVPMGEGTDAICGPTSLLYNEYIVYDVDQVNIKYLIKMHFKYKY